MFEAMNLTLSRARADSTSAVRYPRVLPGRTTVAPRAQRKQRAQRHRGFRIDRGGRRNRRPHSRETGRPRVDPIGYCRRNALSCLFVAVGQVRDERLVGSGPRALRMRRIARPGCCRQPGTGAAGDLRVGCRVSHARHRPGESVRAPRFIGVERGLSNCRSH
jgi:hypothetical protein